MESHKGKNAFESLALAIEKRGKKLKESIRRVGRKRVIVGIEDGAEYPNGKSVAEVAKYIEFGTRNMAPRPFMRTAIREGKEKWKRKIANACKEVAIGKGSNYKQVLTSVGNEARDAIKDSITRYRAVDTGRLRDSIVSRVEDLI